MSVELVVTITLTVVRAMLVAAVLVKVLRFVLLLLVPLMFSGVVLLAAAVGIVFLPCMPHSCSPRNTGAQ